jgi:hypothetical protein
LLGVVPNCANLHHRIVVRRLHKTVIFEAIATLNRVEPLGWLTDVLERMVSGRTKAHELERLLPWSWKAERLTATAHA